MKSYTDIEQSEKLETILPIESADMYWWNNTEEKRYEASLIDYEFIADIDIPAWSLAALMEILNGAAFTRCGTAPECYEATIFYTDEPPVLKRMTCTGTSYVDACYKMIIKLHEMNILSLPKTMEEQS